MYINTCFRFKDEKLHFIRDDINFFSEFRRMRPGDNIHLILLPISYFLHAPLGGETGEGPWYFIGFKEILRWSSQPGWTWILLFTTLLIIWAIHRAGIKLDVKLKQLLLALLFLYSILTITGVFFRGDNWQWENGQREGCLVCHFNVTGFEAAHDPAALGCSSCHGGNPFTLDKTHAHKGMILIPGNIDDAQKSCGSSSCHPDIPKRVSSSIMSTMSGVVTVDRFVFGENKSLSALAHIKDIGHSAADQHLRDLCANCHLGHPKTEPGPVTQLSRGGGCNACHLNYSDSAMVSLTLAKARLDSGVFYHPQLSLAITDQHCFGCHSRSGRIATNYEGWHETLLDRDDIPSIGKYRVLEDQRVFEFIGDDVHHKSGMSCIDCHTSYDLMGDGKLYAHKEEQTRIRCEDCHFLKPPATKLYQDLDAESKKIIALRKWQAADINFIIGTESGLPMVNAWINGGGQALMRAKLQDTLLILKPPLPVCSGGESHETLSCESCHTSWVPQCIGCHNSFDPKVKGFDLLEYREKMGSWVEYVGRFMADQPTLGIIEDSLGHRQVKTFTPGMVLTINNGSYPDGKPGQANQFKRLYAPVSAHTIVREGRTCKSCHLDPLAIGYGRGDLVYDVSSGKGKWIFRNKFDLNEFDRLPEDAWTGFLSERTGIYATRDNARPFNLKEQQAILTAGACLTCHAEDSRVMKESLNDFPALLKKVSNKCVLPGWQ